MSGDNAGSVSTATDSVASTGNLTETDSFFRSSPVVLDPAEEYSMTRKRRGVALIFNQERFFWRLGLNTRSGTNADRHNLERRLLELNFDVRSYDNYKLEDVLEKIHVLLSSCVTLLLKVTTPTERPSTARGTSRICVSYFGRTAARWSSQSCSRWSTERSRCAESGTAMTAAQLAKNRYLASLRCSPRSSTSGQRSDQRFDWSV